MKIAILLPYKENFSYDNAGAVSLFVKDINKKSFFEKNINVFGSTKSKNYLSKNYSNIDVSESNFKSSNKTYIQNFLNHIDINKYEILEVHNRPSYIKQLKEKFNKKVFLYFHNDPLSMDGSSSLSDRKYLINHVDILLFNSKWSRDRFFIGFNNYKFYLKKTEICYQSTNKIKIDFSKKKKIITFIGKLNKAKGFDIFAKSIIKILNKYKDWKAIVIGDEPREKYDFKHKNLFQLGFKPNHFILNKLKSVSISIICSRWEEPFGRASLEAASRGCATIISKRGGLPETSKSAIILDKLNENSLYSIIEKFILDHKYLRKIQKKNYNDFFLTHEYVAKIIDNTRKKHFHTLNLNSFKKNLKIMHITNFNYRFNGRLHYNTGRRINNGFIRLGHNVLTISDRDIINQNKTINDLSGKKKLQQLIIRNYENFKPDIVVLGHADSVNDETLDYLKRRNVKISQWFLDPLSKHGPDYSNNKKRILSKSKFANATFLTTDPRALDFKNNNFFFIPNPCDESFETLNNFNFDNENDLFFAMSHGVHRGQLKKGKFDNRELFVNKLVKICDGIKFDIYGMNDIQPIWSDNFIECVSKSNMGLNLSRGKPIRYYSSDRISQLIGNGLLTFIDDKTYLSDFFNNNEVIFYKDVEDLKYKIEKYKRDNKKRKKIAENGKKFYFKNFNSTLVADYIVNVTLGNKLDKKKYIWSNY